VLGLALQVYTLKLREGRKQIYTIKVSSRSDIGKVVSFLDANEPLKGYKLEQYLSDPRVPPGIKMRFNF